MEKDTDWIATRDFDTLLVVRAIKLKLLLKIWSHVGG